MRRVLPLAAALFLAFAAYSFQTVQLPGRVLACSCAGPPSLDELGRSKGVAFLIATIGPRGPVTTSVTVEGWFLGPADLGSSILVASGTSFGSSCSLYLGTGERWLLTLYLDQDLPAPSTCSVNGRLGTAPGDSLLAEATALFGSPTRSPPTLASPVASPSQPLASPTAAPPLATPAPSQGSTPTPPIEPSPSSLISLAAVAVGTGAIIIGLVVLIARRRPAR